MTIENRHSLDILYKNLEEYALFDPILAINIAEVVCDDYEFCLTHLGELNLRKDPSDPEGNPTYYHSMDGARTEARYWYQSMAPKLMNTKRVVLYGVGLGYYYDFILNWLRKSRENVLIIIEDDLAVLRRFFETEQATKMLSDPQVIISYFDSSVSSPIHEFSKRFDQMIRGYIDEPLFLTTLALYGKTKEEICVMIRDHIFTVSSWNIVSMNEATDPDQRVFLNYYSNVIRQHRSYHAHTLRNDFRGVPALICGAGPSIVKDIETIRSLQDKAIIIASGTGMNVLNHYGIFPHFGTGVDPTSSQGTRIKTNFAYEVPIFYKARFHAESFRLVHSPKLFVQRFTGYPISDWFEPKTGVEFHDFGEEGISSTNFSMEMATLLGCDPIILVGVDLAYTDASRYPRIISEHPADPIHAKKEIHLQSDVPIIGHTYDGKPIHSKIEWFQEALCFINFIKKYSDTTFINATVEGLGMRAFTYMPLKEVKEKYLRKTWDLHGWIHAAIQKSLGEFDKQRCEDAFQEWNNSLDKTADIFNELIDQLRALWRECQKGKSLPEAPYNGRISLLEADLAEEPVSKYLLAQSKEAVDIKTIPEKILYRCHAHRYSQEIKDLKKLEIDLTYLIFLRNVVNAHKNLVRYTLEEYEKEEDALAVEHEKKLRKPLPINDIYEFSDGVIRIYDEELDIDIKVPFTPQIIPEEAKTPFKEGESISDVFITYHGELEGQYLKYDTDGSLFANYFYHHKQLHGPVRYYHSNGQLMASSWFIEGKKEGKSLRYYLSGVLYAVLRYKEGLEHGCHEYFYEDGSYKSEISYSHGKLDGQVVLYYPNGQKKRLLNFKDGKLHGKEFYWQPDGIPIWEAEYRDGKPIGEARAWHSNGTLAREYTYFEDQKHFNHKEWDKTGKLIYQEDNVSEDMRETQVKKRRDIGEAINKFNWEIERIGRLTQRERKQLFY